MQEINRVKFALEHVMGKSVAIFDREGWHRLLLQTGEPTKLEEVPEPIRAVTRVATIAVVTASGYSNPDPGIDLVRYDGKDAPHIYNIDHYTVIQTLCLHPKYPQILSVAGIKEDDSLNNFLREKVFIVGPEKLDHHWVMDLPDHIKNAKSK